MTAKAGISSTVIYNFVNEEGETLPPLDVDFYYEPADMGCTSGPADNWERGSDEYYEIQNVSLHSTGDDVYLSDEEQESLITELQRIGNG